MKPRTLTVDTVYLHNPKAVVQNVIVGSNTPTTGTDSEVANLQKDQKPSVSSGKLPSSHIPTRTLSLNFGNELGRNVQVEKNYAPQGDLGVVNELSYRDPFGEESHHEESTKESDYTRTNGGGSASPPKKNHMMAPSYLPRKEPNVQSPYSADKLPERSYYRNYTSNPSNFSQKSNPNTSYTEPVQKLNETNTENKPYQARAGHARTNSYGSHGEPNSTGKLPPKYGTPTTLKTYDSVPALNAHQVLNGSPSGKSSNMSRYQNSPYSQQKYGSTPTGDQPHYYSDIYREMTTSSPTMLGTNGDETTQRSQQQISEASQRDTNSPGSGANAGSYQSKAKLKSIVAMTPKSVLNMQSNSPTSMTTSSPKYSKPPQSYYSNYAANLSYQQMSPTLKPTHAESSPTSKYTANPNYSYQGQATSIPTYQPAYTPKAAGVSQNTSFNKEATPTYKSYNPSNQNVGYGSPRNYSVSYGNQVTTLSTNTSFNINNPQALTNQVPSQPRLT